jgi:hypothetical protein
MPAKVGEEQKSVDILHEITGARIDPTKIKFIPIDDELIPNDDETFFDHDSLEDKDALGNLKKSLKYIYKNKELYDALSDENKK